MEKPQTKNMIFDSLSGLQKTAILMIALGKDAAAQIFKNFREKDVERLAVEISKLKDIPSSVMEGVIEEFYQMIMAQEYISQGGIEYAKGVLEQALGSRKAYDIVSKVESAIHVSGFNLLKEVDPNQLMNFIQHEHPQTIAMILANLDSEQTASIISELPPEIQSDVAFRIATMGKISPDLLNDVEGVLESHVETVLGHGLSSSGGAKAVADILNMTNRTSEKSILNEIDRRNPNLAFEIKNLMFTFDDIERLDDITIQRVLREIDSKVLTLSLKIASEELKHRIYANMSDRAANFIKQELEFMGPVRLKDIEDAQLAIVEFIRSLEEGGEIIIPVKGNEEEIVS